MNLPKRGRLTGQLRGFQMRLDGFRKCALRMEGISWCQWSTSHCFGLELLLLQLLRELLRELLRQLLVRHLLGQLLWQLLGKLLMDRGRLHWMPPPVRSTWGSNRTAHRADRSGADGLVLATWCDPRVYGWSQGWAQQPKAEAHSRNGRRARRWHWRWLSRRGWTAVAGDQAWWRTLRHSHHRLLWGEESKGLTSRNERRCIGIGSGGFCHGCASGLTKRNGVL